MPASKPDQFPTEDLANPGGAAPNRNLWLSEAGGLTQFGALIEILQPGTHSSIKHWHSHEDELVYVLEGEITLIEGDTEILLTAGDAATFRANVAVGHCFENRSAAPTRCLVIGTRAQTDRVTYPDHDRVLHRDRRLACDRWTDTEGQPADNPYLRPDSAA